MSTAFPLHVALMGAAVVAASATAGAQEPAQVLAAPGLGVAAPAARTPAVRFVSTSRGMMRVIDAAPAVGAGPATAANAAAMSAIKAPAESPRLRSAVANGASLHVLAPLPGAVPAAVSAGAAPGAMLEQTAPNGARVRAIASTASHAASQSVVGLTVVDIDPAGRTAKPSDALRKDVIFRHVASLPTR